MVTGETVEELVRVYLKTCSGRLRPKTLATARSALSPFVQAFRDWQPGDVGAYEIEGLLMERSQSVSPATAHRDLRCIRAFYNALLRWELVERNPVTGVPFPRLPRNIPKILTAEQVQEELRHAKAAGPSLYGMVATALYAGLRRAELVYLEWKDLADRSLILRNKPAHPLKDYEERQVPLHSRLVAALSTLPRDSSYCFPSRTGRAWDPDNLSKWCRRYGLRGFHILRHTFATNCLRSGIDIRTVQAWLGHSNVETTMRYLAGVHDDGTLINRLTYRVKGPDLMSLVG